MFYEAAHINFLPIIRPLFYLNPTDQRLRDIDSLFTIGPHILVVVDIHPSATTVPESHHDPTELILASQTPDFDLSHAALDSTDQSATATSSLAEKNNIQCEVEMEDDDNDDDEIRKQKRINECTRIGERFPHDLLDRNEWVRLHLLDQNEDGNEPILPELYLRRSSLIPIHPLHQFVLPPAEYFQQPLHLFFAFSNAIDHMEYAEGVLYEDDGESFEYRDRQEFVYHKYRVEKSHNVITLYRFDLSPRSSAPALFASNRLIVVVQLNDDNELHPLFQFNQTMFTPFVHPLFPSSTAVSYSHTN